MFEFKNKNILLISPQPWGKMHVSKHHYAIELSKNNKVFFLNPPKRKGSFSVHKKKSEDYKNISIISYRFFFPYNLRFHFRTLFNVLQKLQMKIVLKKINKDIDVIWCFETNLFSNINFDKKAIKIYHPVDNVDIRNQKTLMNSSDFIFSVSDIIINKLNSLNSSKKVSFINHGLSHFFVKENIRKENASNKVHAYFVGNLLIKSLDRFVAKQIISENKNVTFVFIGSFSDNKNTESRFVKFLKSQENVFLKGVMHPKEIAIELRNADVFLVLIDPQKDINRGSNSHKIIEYLSVGKVIVANHLSSYANKDLLIEMVKEGHNKNLPLLFKKVINNLDYYNIAELQEKRISFAIDNTYEKQIKRIENIINVSLK